MSYILYPKSVKLSTVYGRNLSRSDSCLAPKRFSKICESGRFFGKRKKRKDEKSKYKNNNSRFGTSDAISFVKPYRPRSRKFRQRKRNARAGGEPFGPLTFLSSVANVDVARGQVGVDRRILV